MDSTLTFDSINDEFNNIEIEYIKAKNSLLTKLNAAIIEAFNFEELGKLKSLLQDGDHAKLCHITQRTYTGDITQNITVNLTDTEKATILRKTRACARQILLTFKSYFSSTDCITVTVTNKGVDTFILIDKFDL